MRSVNAICLSCNPRRMDYRLLIGLLLTLIQLSTINGSGTIEVELIKFSNPWSILDNGHCCDGYPSICTSQCDHRFHLCLADSGSPTCTVGQEVLDGPKDTDVINDFPEKQISKEFSVWKTVLELRTNVTDVDAATELSVDTFVMNLNDVHVANNLSVAQQTALVRQLTGRRSVNATSLDLKVSAYCDLNYFGDDCSVFCIGENSCQGHFTCSPKGERDCLPGWGGPYCNTAIPGDVADCGYGIHEKLPRVWTGEFSCDTFNESLDVSVHNVLTSAVNGTIRFRDAEYEVNGLWLGNSLTLTPSSTSWIVQSPRNIPMLSFVVVRSGTSSYSGTVYDASRECGDVTLSYSSVASLPRCLNGATCIRDVASGANICCCAPYFTGENCQIRITLPTTRSTLSTNATTTSAVSIPPETSTMPPTNPATTEQTKSSLALSESTAINVELTSPPVRHSPSTEQVDSSTLSTEQTTLPTTIKEMQSISTETSQAITTGAQEPTTIREQETTSITVQFQTSVGVQETTNGGGQETTPIIAQETTTFGAQERTTFGSQGTTSVRGQEKTTLGDQESTTVGVQETTNGGVQETTSIGAQETTTIRAQETTTFGAEESTTFGVQETTSIGAKETTTIRSQETTFVGQERTTIRAQETTTFGSEESTTFGGQETTKGEAQETTSIGVHETTTIGAIETTNALSMDTTTAMQETSTSTIPETTVVINPKSTTIQQTEPSTSQQVAISSESASTTQTFTIPSSTDEPSVHQSNVTYTVLLPGVQDDIDYDNVTEAIKKSYIHSNSELRLTVTDIVIYYSVEEAIGENREFIVEFSYNLTVTITLTRPLIVPSFWVIRQQILQIYTPGLYEGHVWFYLRDNFNFLIEGTPPSVFQYFSIETVLEYAWMKNLSSSCKSCSINITIPTTEEVVGENGATVTRVYYFITYNGALQSPGESFWKSVPDGLQSAFQFHNLTLTLYQGVVRFRYRYHYSLAFEGYVYQESFTTIQTQLYQIWMSRRQEWASCQCANVTVVRGDKFITSTGTEITKIVYFIAVLEKYQSPVVVASLPHETFVSSINVINPRTKQMYVVKETITLTIYRSELQLSFFVKDMVDVSVISTFQQRLQLAWRSHLNGYKGVTVVIPKIAKCIGKTVESEWVIGQEVSRIMYYLIYKEEVINPHWNKPVHQSTIAEYVRNVTSTSGHVYEAYTVTQSLTYTKEQHYAIHLNGHVVIEHITDVIASIKDTWETVYTGSSITVTVGMVEEFCSTDDRKLITGLFYILKVNSRLMDASVEYKAAFNYSHLTTRLQASSLQYILYQGIVTSLISYRYQLHVYFSQSIAELDYEQIEVKLGAGWTSMHAEITNTKIFVARVEQFYTETRTSVWRLAYFIRQQGVAVYPLHLPKVPHHQWITCGCVSVTGISGHVYKLYSESTVTLAKWIPYSYHFSLSFQKQVSKLDYVSIEQRIQAAWTGRNINVTVNIISQEEYITASGHSVWRIIYFVSRSTSFIFNKQYILPSVYVRRISAQSVDLSFVNVFGGYYHLYSVNVHIVTKNSQAFTFYANNAISERNTVHFATAIREVFCRQITVIANCDDITPVIIRQQGQISSTSWQWRMQYYLEYNGRVVDSTTWPQLNTTAVQQYVHNVLNVTAETGTSYVITPTLPVGSYDYRFHFSLYMKTKVNTADFKNFANSIRLTWLTKHSEYATCECVKVFVQNQEELLTENGEKYWKLVYYLNVNGTIFSPVDTLPLNHTVLEEHISFTGPRGHYVIIPENSYNFNAYDFRYSNALYLQTWVTKEDYHRFERVLIDYYKSQWSGTVSSSDIHVKINGIRQVTTPDGALVWRLVYFVRVKDKLVYPDYLPAISYTYLAANVAFTTPTGLKYSLYTGNVKELWSASSFFHFYLNHPVAPAVWGHFRLSILEAVYLQYPDYRTCGCLELEFPQHQTELIKETGESVWQVGYRLKVRGILKDSETSPLPDITKLQQQINFPGPNGIKYTASLQAEKTVTARSTFSVLLNHYVSTETLEAIKTSIMHTWATIKPDLDISRIQVNFIRQKEYTDTTGRARWKFEYTVHYNNTVIQYGDWQKINISVLHTKLQSVQTANGESYQAFNKEDVAFIQYRQQFSLFSKTKIAVASFTEVKSKLVTAWEVTHPEWKTCSCLEISNIRQEEILDQRGQSVWKLVYTVKMNGTVVDATLVDNLTPAILETHLAVQGPKAQYKLYVPSLVTQQAFTRYDYSFAFHLTNKLDIHNIVKVQSFLGEMIREKQIDVKETVTVSIQKQEEYLSEAGKTVWKVVCFAKQKGEYLPTSALAQLNHTELDTMLETLHGPRGQKFTVVTAISLLQYRYHFSVYLTSRVSIHQYWQFENVIEEVWAETKEEYKNCSCLTVNIVSQEEVVDIKGVSSWKLVYYLHVNQTLVESLTSVDVNYQLLADRVSVILRPTRQTYEVVHIEEASVIRTQFTHSILLNSEVGLFDQHNVTHVLRLYWQSIYTEWHSCNCLDVTLNRQQSFLVLQAGRWITIWSLEYVISVNEMYVDRETVYSINNTELQQTFISMSTFLGREYEVTEVTSESLVEYRWHFPLYISREVKQTDFVHFEQIVKTVWSVSTAVADVNVSISQQEEVVDQRGESLWKLVVFIQNGTTFLDSSISPPINTSEVVSKLVEQKITGARGTYNVVNIDSSRSLQRYDVTFPLFLNVHVYAEDLIHISQTLVATWTTVYQEFYSSFHLDVEVIRQEDFISVTQENVAKLVYVLKSNSTVQSSTRLPKLSTTEIETKLQANLVTARYHVIAQVSALVRYEQHFQLTLTKPLLQTDKVMFQTQLQEAWSVSKTVNISEVSVKITSQEEITAVEQSQSLSLWRILYVVKQRGEVISAVLETDITNTTLRERLNSTRHDEHVTYTDLIYTGDVSTYTVYKQLFVVHSEQKIAVESYASISTSIETAWKNSTDKSITINIVSQEKIYTSRKYVWKLSYTVTEQLTVLRSDMIRGPDIETFRQHITISNPFGKVYQLVKVDEELRLSYSLSIFLSSRIMLSHQEEFVNTLKMVWMKHHSELALTDVDIEFQGYERFLDNKQHTVWRHVCFVSMKGHVINSAEYRRLNVTAVQYALKANMSYFPSDKYQVVGSVVDSSFKDYSLLYSVYFLGRPGSSLLHELVVPVMVAWFGKYPKSSAEGFFSPEIINRKEAIGAHGVTLTQVTYFISFGGKPFDPLTIPAPSGHDIVRNVNESLGVQAYTGDLSLVHEYSFSFWVNLRGLTTSLDSREIIRSLTKIFSMANFVDVQVDLLKLEQYSGNYGVPVTKVLYSVHGNDTVLDPGLINNSIGSLIVEEARENKWRVYSKTMYRLEVIYSLTVRVQLAKADKWKLETAIAASFKDNRTSPCSVCNVSVSIVNGEMLVNDEGFRLTRVAYTVHKDTIQLENWKNPQPYEQILEQYLTEADPRYVIWTSLTYSIESVYIVKSANSTLDKVREALVSAWHEFINGSININATEDKTYVDEEWNGVVRIDYTVAVNGTVPAKDNQMTPAGAHLISAFEQHNVKICKCLVRKLRRMYIKGEGTNVTEAKLREAIVTSWLTHNPEISKSDMAVVIKPGTKRRKRATTSAPKLVDKDGKGVTAVLYTVGVDGEEPRDLFVAAPSPETIDSQLKNKTGMSLCNCTPSLSHTVRVAGNLTDKQKEAVKEAIKDALVAANPDLNKDDLNVDIKNVKTEKDENGNTVSDVDYTVSHKGGFPVEDLVSPSEEQMEKSLNKHGLSLPDNTKKKTVPVNDNWKIIVGVVVGVGGFVVICAAIAYYYVHKRRQKDADLPKRAEGIQSDNKFDKENFSEPVNFNNPSFDANRHPLDPFSTKSV